MTDSRSEGLCLEGSILLLSLVSFQKILAHIICHVSNEQNNSWNPTKGSPHDLEADKKIVYFNITILDRSWLIPWPICIIFYFEYQAISLKRIAAHYLINGTSFTWSTDFFDSFPKWLTTIQVVTHDGGKFLLAFVLYDVNHWDVLLSFRGLTSLLIFERYSWIRVDSLVSFDF